MKKLTSPLINDQSILKQMCGSLNLVSSHYLSNEYFIMYSQYACYGPMNGDPHLCIPAGINSSLKAALEKHYRRPLKILSYIDEIRDSASPDVCPMCGSLKTGTVDHYLPQANYPEWTIFSLNLVPSCDCNSKRSNIVKGSNPSERVLHPYFDTCLDQRLVICLFNGNLDLPSITLDKLINDPKVEFHLENVVRKSTIISWLGKMWANLKRTPETIIYEMSETALVTYDDVEQALVRCLRKSDQNLGTPNNWHSIFFHGLLSSPTVIRWIVERRNGIINRTIDPHS